jgi:hypothetical protein
MQVHWQSVFIGRSVSMETGDGADSFIGSRKVRKGPVWTRRTHRTERAAGLSGVRQRQTTGHELVRIPPTQNETIIVLRERSQWPRLT